MISILVQITPRNIIDKAQIAYNKYVMKNSKLLFNLILFLILAVISVSCDKGPVYENYLKMKNQTWDRFDQKLFEIPIEDVSKSYDITIALRNIASFQYDDMPVYVILTTPSGEERMREVTIPVRNNGKMLGLPNGTVYEARFVLWKGINLADKGKCKISIENMIPKIQTEGIDGIGIIVTASK